MNLEKEDPSSIILLKNTQKVNVTLHNATASEDIQTHYDKVNTATSDREAEVSKMSLSSLLFGMPF